MKILQPYLRDYKSKREVLDAFNGGKDFVLNDMSNQRDGKPINKAQIEAGEKICFRYAENRKVLYHVVGK